MTVMIMMMCEYIRERKEESSFSGVGISSTKNRNWENPFTMLTWVERKERETKGMMIVNCHYNNTSKPS